MNPYVLLIWQTAEPPAGGLNPFSNILFIGIAIAIIYFMLIRPQSQQRKKATEFASALSRGQKVVTIGGIHGHIAEINEKTIELIIAPKVHITVQREAISMESTKAAYGGGE